MKKINLYYLLTSSLIVVVDQATKYYIQQQYDFLESVYVAPFFNLMLVYNKGAAFSFLSFAGGWQRLFFIIISLIAIAFLSVYICKKIHFLYKVSFCLILGGTIGNLYDRITYGYVIDFLQFHIKNFYWPIFNVADSAITIGAIILFVLLFKAKPFKSSSTIR